MKAILLCAGYATRLYPLTTDQPKALLPVGGRPILDYLLEEVAKVRSVEQVYLISNDRFYPHFQRWAESKDFPWKIEVVNDGTYNNETRLGAIGDLAFVVEKFRLRDDLAVFCGDNLFRFDLGSFFAFAETHRPHGSLGIVDVGRKDIARQYGIVLIDKKNQILEFFEKPKEPLSTLASTGVYWFPKENLNLLDRYIHEDHNADRPGDYIRWLVEIDRVFAYPFEGKWLDIGDLDSYRQADRLFSKSRRQPS